MPDTDQDNKPLHGPNLILDVENFGPIAEAKNIEFRPMTVFVGPSNTGKSYLAMLLHAMLQGMNGFRNAHTQFMNPHFANLLSIDARHELAAETAKLSSQYSAYTHDAQMMPIVIDQFSHAVGNSIRKIAGSMLAELSRVCISSIEEVFESDIDNLGNVANIVSLPPSISLSDLNGQLIINAKKNQHNFHLPQGIIDIDARFARLYTPENGDNQFVDAIAVTVTQSLLRMMMKSWSTVGGSIYFPAARTGILTSHKLMTDSLITNAHRVGVDAQAGIAYHKVAREFLRLINLTPRDFAYPRNRNADPASALLDSAADRLEESVIVGEIEVRDSNWGPPDFHYRPGGNRTIRLPMFKSSSMVTEVAPIVHFLRTHVRMGDLLIVEEPEAHLHPEAQQRMAAALAYMVRIGLRVLVTTHSHYIVEQLGALVNAGAGSVDPGERERHLGLLGRQIDRHLYLKQGEVAVYEFEPGRDIGAPANVNELAFDGDYLGYYPLGYSKALMDQRNRNVNMIGAREGF